jgi:diguanylate cyclase (GGDEF)-like protein
VGHLDLVTLFVVAVFITLLVGTLLVFTWLRDRHQAALAWWGGGHLLGAPGLTLLALRGHIPDPWSMGVSNLLMLVVAAVAWGGARRFEHRPVRPLLLALPLLPWVAGTMVPGFYDVAASNLRVALFSAIVAFYAGATALEFWRGRGERLLSRWPAIGFLLVHCGWFAARFVLGLLSPAAGNVIPVNYLWIVLTVFEILIFGVSFAFLALSMTKEREELRYRAAAGVDPVTGAANRRAFSEAMAGMSLRDAGLEVPVAFLLFDIDHFKNINDNHGHAFGDQVLRMFADLARGKLRAGDLFSRIGGEEFAAVLIDVDEAGALATAERIRRSFEEAGRTVGGQHVGVTVSVGLATRDRCPSDFEAMFDEADAGLYLAKAAGRNLVRFIQASDVTGDSVPAKHRRPSMPRAPAAA